MLVTRAVVFSRAGNEARAADLSVKGRRALVGGFESRAGLGRQETLRSVPGTQSLGIGARGVSQLNLGALLRRSDLPSDDRGASDSRHRCISSRTNTVARSSHA